MSKRTGTNKARIEQIQAAMDRPPAGEAPRTEAGRRLLPVIENMADAAGPSWSPAEGSLRLSILAIEREAASAAPEGLDRVSLAAAIQSAGLPMHYVHKIMDEYARLSELGSPPPWRDDSDACPTCAHRPHDPGKCKARYRVTLAEDEEGDPCLCGALASLVRRIG